MISDDEERMYADFIMGMKVRAAYLSDSEKSRANNQWAVDYWGDTYLVIVEDFKSRVRETRRMNGNK